MSLPYELVLQTLDSVETGRCMAYFSCPITSGRRLYEQLELHRVKSREELVSRLGLEGFLQAVRWPNVADARGYVEKLRETTSLAIVNTAEIYVPGWDGEVYMQMCFQILERKVFRVYFHPEWAMSSGASKELLFCVERGIETRLVDESALTLDIAMHQLYQARNDLARRHLDASKIESRLQALESLQSRVQ